jgi:photosystem II stability/assembly factor-like uncharacterized protein
VAENVEPFFGSTLVRTSDTSAYVVVTPAIGGTASLYVTDDGARSWSTHLGLCPGGAFTAAFAVAPDGTLWLACGSEPAAGNQFKSIYRSLDGGRTWIPEATCAGSFGRAGACPAIPELGYVGTLVAISADSAFLSEGRNSVLKTVDGGTTWFSTGIRDDGSLAMDFVDADHGWAIPDIEGGATLCRTIDGGSQWNPAWQSPSLPAVGCQ